MTTDELQKIFEDKVDNEIKIEPKDWMPDEYRKDIDTPDKPACT